MTDLEVNTSITSLIPVLCLLFFGGSTLRDFAFALTMLSCFILLSVTRAFAG